MSTSVTGQGSSISQHLHATKKILQDVVFDVNVPSITLDVLEQDAFEVLRLIRSWRNRLSPINRLPPEVLALIPDFLNTKFRDRDVIALTHVCRSWRRVFISLSSLWTNFHCMDADKTRVYLERSKSSPINVWLDKDGSLSPHDPLLQVIPHTTDRLKALAVEGSPGNIQAITAHLCRPAPFLDFLSIDGGCAFEPERNPMVATALFNGDLSSLHVFSLQSVRTELPWRNMVNLTSFTLCHILPADVSIGRLLDFFESAPHLHKIQLYSATPTSGTQDGRLVSLACLKSMAIAGKDPSSLLLDHLLIPIGAKLTISMDSRGFLIEDRLPRSLNNLRNLSNFTKINLRLCGSPRMRFTGPNGRVSMYSFPPAANITHLVLESLARFDTSKTEQLKIFHGNPSSMIAPYRALFSMGNLRGLTLAQCGNPYFINALHPAFLTSDVVVCPKLEELVLILRPYEDVNFNIECVISMAAARASRGSKLKSVRIVNWDELTTLEAWNLRRHVLHVECGPGVDVANDDSDSSDGED